MIFPTIKTLELDSAEINSVLEKINSFDWIIFTSVNTVKIFFSKLAKLNLSIKESKLQFAVIGPKVKEELEKNNFKTSFIPTKYVSETFINEFKDLNLNESKILIPCSEIARDLIYEDLVEKKLAVTKLNIYTTIKPETSNIESVAQLITKNELDYITFTSPSTITNFFELLEKYDIKNILSKNKAKIICIGPTTGRKFEESFEKKPLIPTNHTVDGILEIINYY